MLQNGITDGAAEICIRERNLIAGALQNHLVPAAFASFAHRPCPGVQTDINRLIKGDGHKMTVPAAQIQYRSFQLNILVHARFYCAQKAAEIGHVAQLQP